MGYSGGTTVNPTYHNIGDHSETVQVDFDPDIVSYEQLLDAFWSGHSPTFPSFSRQYRSAIFFYSDEQQHKAMESRARQEEISGKTLYTDIEPATPFYLAEDYHQKYYLRENSKLWKEISTIYPNTMDVVNSTAAARLNGYIGGYGDTDTLLKQIDELGLSENGKQELSKVAKSGLTRGCPVS